MGGEVCGVVGELFGFSLHTHINSVFVLQIRLFSKCSFRLSFGP